MDTETIRILKSAVKNLKSIGKYDFDSRYVCDSKGNVYLLTDDETEKYFVCKEMKPFITKDGYVEYVLTLSNGDKQHIQAQIIVARLYLAKVRGKDYVNHLDGDKSNNKYTNLEWSTQSENIEHTYTLGRVAWNKGK
jgi:hypothetical protein